MDASLTLKMSFPVGSVGKECACNAGDTGQGFDPWVWEDPLEEEMAIFCLENPMDRGAW